MRFLVLLGVLLLAACGPPSPATPTAALPLDAWQPWAGGEVLQTSDGISALRHAPTAVTYGHVFEPAPAAAQPVGVWLRRYPDAVAAVNCGFFREDAAGYAHIGLLMTAGELQAGLRSNWGGVLIVRDGSAFVAGQPQRLLAPAALGVQGWPLLAMEGRALPRLNDQEQARRTAVGVDAAGRVVWVAAVQARTLAEFAARLLAPDLALTAAINLDGGSSTGLRWLGEEGQLGADSLPVPCALLLYPPEASSASWR